MQTAGGPAVARGARPLDLSSGRQALVVARARAPSAEAATTRTAGTGATTPLPRGTRCRRRPLRTPPAALPPTETIAAALTTAATTKTTWSTLPPPTHDALCFALAAAGGYAWVKIFDVLAASGRLDRKLSRKLVHATAGPFLVLCWPLFSAADPAARFIAAAVPALNAARLALVGSGALGDPGLVASVSRQGGRSELLKGPLYYVIVLSALTAVFWRDFPLPALAAVSMMCGGDGLADIVGRRLGASNPLPWNPAKSWAGSAAMAFGGMATAVGMVTAFQAAGWEVVASGGAGGWSAVLPRLLAICVACTAAESLPANRFVDDNLSVPAVAVIGSLLLFAPVSGSGVGTAALVAGAAGVAVAVSAANAVAEAREEGVEEMQEKQGDQQQQHSAVFQHQQQQQHHQLGGGGGGGNGATPAADASSPSPLEKKV